MKPVIPISLTRMAVKRMDQVQRGQLSHQAARRDLQKVCTPNRSELIAYLTKHYSKDAVAFRYFDLL